MTVASRSPGILVLSAPSGGGKTSLARALADSRSDAEITVSHTTRTPRPGEVNGVHYRFVDAVRFEEMIRQRAFIEYATVYGNLYGTSYDAVDTLFASGKHAILDIDWQGARNVCSRYPRATTVFIMPPSIETLEQRLRERNQDSESVIRQRMELVEQEISHKDEFDIVVVNENFDESLAALHKILDSVDTGQMPV